MNNPARWVILAHTITVLRSYGLRIAIFRHDHEPPHVHVFGDGEARILLSGADGLPELIEAQGFKFGDVRKALLAVTEHREMLIEQWSKIHG